VVLAQVLKTVEGKVRVTRASSRALTRLKMTGMPGHRLDDDMSKENIENQYGEMAGSSTSSKETSTLENSNYSMNGSIQRWFPYDDCFKVDEKTLTSSEVISTLSPYLADERKQRIKEVITNRTYSVCIAVEGLLELGNIAAVFRSADALGFQSVHVISSDSKKK
jgi:hypothetical protein